MSYVTLLSDNYVTGAPKIHTIAGIKAVVTYSVIFSFDGSIITTPANFSFTGCTDHL